ncbi:hypothetical protein A3A78_00745 [candidate division WWE3 bacterium RIFCSPLOWO2_01_FULL_41_18]|uniref:Single-stranded DNA-binding protein n=1 Tax=candidate division WWE3 bacterium RIFCSPLOWO2_01_FULL_41_18 TaxID=1802625 RepID=A0A1F4VEV6_UNCKA|nr:MAG: hypothetical protein A3A78_00745 [candidate division WWE3 bacterium RIFCSPLOWO2_01_FULL_41_18]
MSRSLNKVTLIGNLTRDPEMRFTPQGHAVTNFGVATNRDWKVEGDRREETEFHNVIAWNKLAELCNQLLKKGTKVYIEGRLQTRDWTDDKGVKHYRTEIVSEDMIVLSSRRDGGEVEMEPEVEKEQSSPSVEDLTAPKKKAGKGKKSETSNDFEAVGEDLSPEQIPF